MDFKGFYDEIIFDVDRSILKSYTGKQGDTKSRGLYVTVTQKSAVIEDLTGLSMRLFYEKPDKTRGFIDGVVDGSKFRIDYTNQMYAVPGVVTAELRLMGVNGEIITAKTFKILVDSSIADGSIVSKNERGILDRAFELAEDIIPRLELLDVELLEDVQNEMLQSQLKVAKVEKELNDYKATMQQVNINQEPKQKATGYGVISLPPNAAEGQVSGVVRGLTATNLIKNGDFRNGLSGWAGVSIHQIKTDTSRHLTGFQSVRFEQEVGTLTDYRLRQDIKVPDGHKVYYRAYIFCENIENSVYMRFRMSDIGGYDNNVEITKQKREDFLLNQWECLSMIREVTLGSGGIRFELTVYSNDSGGLTLNADGFLAIDLTATFGAGNEPTLEECDKIFSNYFDGTKSTVGAMRLKSVSADETETSTAYVVAKDEEGTIAELRSLPNGTKDEIRVSEGKLIKRVSDVVDLSKIEWVEYVDGHTANYYAVSYQSPIVWSNPCYLNYNGSRFGVATEFNQVDNLAYYYAGTTTVRIKIPKTAYAGLWTLSETKTWLQNNQITLTYQLAEPIEIPVQVSGTLTSYPNGTVYVEPVVADAGVYADGISVLHQDLPIDYVEKLSRVDFTTGLETELDVSKVVVSEDRKSFTHPDLVDGDIVFFTYHYDVESTIGETTIEYYDSRYVLKDDVTGKFYKVVPKVSNGELINDLMEV